MSLRSKFVLALLLSSQASAGLVGGVAYYELMRKFDDRMLQDAFGRFRGDVLAYVGSYGSWQQAEQVEPFGEFVMRRHQPAAPQPGKAGRPSPPSLGEPPPPDNSGQTAAPAPQGAQPPPPGDRDRPPFQFVLFDASGKALLSTLPYRKGDQVSEQDRARSLPIAQDGQIVAYALPQGVATLSDRDIVYLKAMRAALVYGALAATAMALILGLVFGNALSRALRRLTRAIQSMGEGSLHQHVEVESRDEVGVLARSFNRMSADLARSHAQLEHSNKTIREQAARLEELSIRDFLTQLYNRRHFDEQAARLFDTATRYQRPLSVMIGDIDFFKQINDRYTHATGDIVLRHVAEILRENSRATDLVARYGGEEFVIAFPETPLPQAVAQCEKLRGIIEGYSWGKLHPELRVTMSMGVHADLAVGAVEKMLQRADSWLYQAKHSGRNRVCYT
ncbi:MAG TPA: diguanylate cyclase [Gammaproteobacteria bacterium]|nr:diguanylate cyclase [Gammaproteobacteria bacterium]